MILRKFKELFKYKSKLVFKRFDSTSICASRKSSNIYLASNETFIYANDIFRQLHTSTTTICRSFREKLLCARDTLINNENVDTFSMPLEPKDDIDISQAELLIETDWTNMNSTEMLSNFEILSHYACKNNEIFNDPKYEGIAQALSNQCPKFSNKELLYLLNYLNLWDDKNHKQRASNFWHTFNDELFVRKSEWSTNDILLINDNIFKLNRLNYTKFSRFSIDKLAKKTNTLSKIQLTQLILLMNSFSKLNVNIYNFEYCLEKFVDDLSINDIAIFAMICFKYKNTIKNADFNEKILQLVSNQISTIHDDCLTQILKMVRYKEPKHIDLAHTILKSLETQVSSRSPRSLIQILDFQKMTLIYNKTLTLEILKRLEPEIKDLKFQDIATLVSVLALLNFNPKTTSIYSVIVDNLLNQSTNNSIIFIKILCYLAMVDCYNEEALKLAMDLSDFKTKNEIFYAKSYQFFLHYSLKIDYPQYCDSISEKEKFIKCNISLVKFKNLTESLRNDVATVCKRVIGSELAVHVDTILPHTSTQSIVICYDEKTKQFIPPGEILSEFEANKIKYPPADGRKWYALLTNTNAHRIKSTATFTGDLVMQLRQLERIGYIPISILNDDWKQLDESERQTFISKILCI